MASTQALGNPSSSSFQAFQSFKADIQEKLSWMEEEWSASHLTGSDIYYFCRNIRHWFGRLIEVQDLHYLVITTFSSRVQVRPSFRDIIQAYKVQFGLEGLLGASQAINPNYVILCFARQELKLQVLQNFCLVGQSFVINSEWLPHKQPINFQLNWLPPDVPLVEIQNELEKFAVVSDLRKEILDLGEGDSVPTGKVLGSLVVDDITTLDSLPHFLRIGRYSFHWIIYQRQPVCFACKVVGHVAPCCPTPFCVHCRSFLPRSHLCTKPTNYSLVRPPVNPGASTKNSTPVLMPVLPLASPNGRQVSQVPNLSAVQLHSSWMQEFSSTLPSTSVASPKSTLDVFSLEEKLVLSPSPVGFDAQLFENTMESLQLLQKETDLATQQLKSLPAGAKIETVRSGRLPQTLGAQAKLVQPFPLGVMDSTLTTVKVSLKNKQSKKK